MGITRYEISQATNETPANQLLYVTYSKFENDWPSLVHSHQFSEFTYVIGGKGYFQIGDREYPITKDDFIIVNPNIPHTEKSTGEDPLEYVVLGVSNLSFAFDGNKDYAIFSCADKSDGLLFYMNALLEERRQQNSDYALICQRLLDVLLVKLRRKTNSSFQPAPLEKISRECQKLKRYIEMNYTQNITLDSLAEMSHLNKYYLVHMFTKYCGSPPISYLGQVRIQASKELLASTDYSITEIAQLSGFSSQSYFAQSFQKHCHMTAGAYRKACQKQ